MEPSIHSGDLVIIQRFSKMINHIDKGDVVIAKSPEEYNKFIMKRVKAIDGQMVRRGIKYQVVSNIKKIYRYYWRHFVLMYLLTIKSKNSFCYIQTIFIIIYLLMCIKHGVITLFTLM